MGDFAFIVCPLNVNDFARRSAWAKYLPGFMVKGLLTAVPSLRVTEITGLSSPCGQSRGWVLTLPLNAGKMARLADNQIASYIIQEAKTAEKLGAGIIGVGCRAAASKEVFNLLRKNIGAAIVTGSRYSLMAGLEGIREAAGRAGLCLKDAYAALIGADSPVGWAYARLLAGEVKNMALVSGNKGKLEELAGRIFYESGLSVNMSANAKKAVEGAGIVVAAPGAENIIIPADILPGSIFCDFTPLRREAGRVAREGIGVLVMEGVFTQAPGVDNIDIDACMAETMLLAMEGRHESYWLTERDMITSVREMGRLAGKHNFKLKTIYTVPAE